VRNDPNPRRLAHLVFLLVALSPLSAFAADEFVAQAVSVSGKVLVRGEGTGTAMTFLKPGDKLFKGSIVNTGSNGAVKLLMTDRTIVDLGPTSLFKINDYKLNTVADRQVDLTLDYGQARTSVNEKLTANKGKFTIRTKAATMGVRGTEFVVNAPIPVKDASGNIVEPPKTALTVMHGKVEVNDANLATAAPVAINPGFQYAKMGEGPAQVAELKANDVAKIKAEAFQKDMTFVQTVTFDPGAKQSESGQSTSSENRADPKDRGGKPGDEKSPPPVADGGANRGAQTIENIGTTIETQSQQAPPPVIGDFKLPGTFTPEVPQIRPIDQLNGRLVNLRIRVCPSGGPC
jgi:hypothetical protein